MTSNPLTLDLPDGPGVVVNDALGERGLQMNVQDSSPERTVVVGFDDGPCWLIGIPRSGDAADCDLCVDALRERGSTHGSEPVKDASGRGFERRA
jgi:hypothetical protein